MLKEKVYNMGEKLKMIGVTAAVVGTLLSGVLLAGRSCNKYLNNRVIDKPAYHTVSFATGLAGHVEYTRYFDGSQDVKIYPYLGHRMFSSELDQDLDGDGKVDRIRKDGSEFKGNRLAELLIRKYDYDTKKETFDNADRRLQDLMKKHRK